MMIDNYSIDRVLTMDKTSIVTYNIYKSYMDNDLDANSVAEILNDLLKDIRYTKNKYVYNSISKLLLQMFKDGNIHENDIKDFVYSGLEAGNLRMGYLLINIITVNKHFKIIPMIDLIEMLCLDERMYVDDRLGYLYNGLDNKGDTINSCIYVMLYNHTYRKRVHKNKVPSFIQRDYELARQRVATVIGCSNDIKYNVDVLYEEYRRITGLSNFTNNVLYEINVLEFNSMLDKDKEYIKNIYYNNDK